MDLSNSDLDKIFESLPSLNEDVLHKPRKNCNDHVYITIRSNADIKRALQQMADQEQRSLSNMLTIIIKRALANQKF